MLFSKEDLTFSSMAKAALKIGDKAPDFSLVSDTGETVKLKDLKGKKVILYFYPKDMTPGCTQQACDFRDNRPTLSKKKVLLFGVSKDSVERHTKFKEKYELDFPLLSDEDGKACKAFGVWKEKSLYGRKFMGIERTTFIIDEKGKILAIFPKVKVKGHIDAVLTNL